MTKAVTTKFSRPNGNKNFRQNFINSSKRSRGMLARTQTIKKSIKGWLSQLDP